MFVVRGRSTNKGVINMGDIDWDEQISYLQKTIGLYYNDDYLRFLVETVWQIHKPVHVIDFGCGFGHVGLRLLPFLPEGSSYTGIDAGVELIEVARQLFQKLPYPVEFIVGDFHTISIEKTYDLAVCHAVLLHLSEPVRLLTKMIHHVKAGGKMIAFEPHWNAAMASYSFEGIDQSSVIPIGLLQRLFERDAKRTGKDGNIGLKLPLLFQQLGLREVQCRQSDKVHVSNPQVNPEDAARLYKALAFPDPGDPRTFTSQLQERGMSREEAERQYAAEKLLSIAYTASVPMTYAPSMKITFGTV